MKTLLPEINSADKRFHNGNPATGEQGTRVTDTWLNDVQDRIRDMQEEAHYVLQQAGFTPKAETKTQLYQAIVKIIEDNRQLATTQNAGIVQLNSTTNSTSETEAATPKAVKTLKDLLDSVNRNQANYIPNSKKSSSLSSPSSDTVATSVAVKTAYEKGVEGLNAANNANNNANGRVSKAGDTMTGNLTINHAEPRFHGNRNNNYNWYVGLPNGTSDDLHLHSYANNTTLSLESDKIKASKPLYVGNNSVVMMNNFTENLADNGWCKLPNGLILQWGQLTVQYETVKDYLFNLAFPHRCCAVLVSNSVNSGALATLGARRNNSGYGSSIGNSDYIQGLNAYPLDRTKMRLWNDQNTGQENKSVNWLAIGF
ncbi:hypothetical protein BKG93_02230 [Rodentibacter ratti]|uniref:Uncharacterized protein n=1 Tax=Rodentibacter ratti TaxID=1906745 RepID=A0A1V3L9U4_9PAST|nr:tail fiber protein [Rodentibacter ratti]OOF86699.1 hypothetical protein BKG93_02230 [Rodentibacter ratti]